MISDLNSTKLGALLLLLLLQVLTLLIGWLKSVVAANQSIYADLSEVNILPVSDLFNNCPVITVLTSQLLIVILFAL